MTRPVRFVVVVGRDAAAWMAAIALRRGFARSGVEVRVVEAPSALHPPDVYVTLPTLDALHRLLGVETDDILAEASAMPVLAQRFSGWGGSRPPFLHAYDTHGVDLNHVPFLQHWIKARSQGLRVPHEDFSIGAAAAKQGRLVVPTESSASFSRAASGYHLDAGAYVRLLRRLAVKLGVAVTPGVVRTGVRDPDSGFLRSVVLADDRTVEGDLFIDASGGDAVLIGRVMGGELESWTRWLPCDRVLSVSAPRLSPAPGFSQISAFSAGWAGIFPLGDRTALTTAFSSRHASDSEALSVTAVLSGLRQEGDAELREIEPGARPAPWVGNCIAIGEAAVSLEPLDAVPLHLVHLGLSHLIPLFPVDRDSQPESAVYNRAVGAAAANLRDFQIAHYALNGRLDEAFWDEVRNAPLPETLAYKIELFKARGVVALYDDETFDVDDWASIFIGHGLQPRAYDPLVDLSPEAEQIPTFQRMLGFIKAQVEDMPSLEAHLEMQGSRDTGLSF